MRFWEVVQLPKLSTEEINDIRSKVDIVDVIGEYVPLEKSGKNFFGVCPFHDDHSPSMSVSREKQIYNCFSCGAGGNVYTFLMNYENISFIEAVDKVAHRIGMDLKLQKNKPMQSDGNEDLYEMYNYAVMLYQNNIHSQIGEQAKKYLRERELSDEIIKEFKIGLASTRRDDVTKFLRAKKYKDARMIQSGICSKNEYGMHDVFINRIIFPLCNPVGQVVGFSGRQYNLKTQNKYINSTETPIFKKGETLYNYYKAKEFVKRDKCVIITEGFMDVIRLYSVGIKNAIASMGTAITKEHTKLIRRLSTNVVMCFDGDDAGIHAAYACGLELEKVNIHPKVIVLEDGLDPDDFIRERGKEAFLEHLEHPQSFLDFKLNYYRRGKDLRSKEELAIYINQVKDELAHLKDDVLKTLTIDKLAEETGINRDLFGLEVKQMKQKPVVNPKPVEQPRALKHHLDKYHKAERALLHYMLYHKEISTVYKKRVSYLPSETYRFLANEMVVYYQDHETLELADFITFLKNNDSLIQTLNEVVNFGYKEDYSDCEIEDYLHTLHEYNLNFELDRLNQQLRQEMDLSKKIEIVQQITELKMRSEQNE